VASEILRQTHRDAKGRLWQVAVVPTECAEQEDARFWYEELSPEERVMAVHECVKSALLAQGVEHVPRLRRVARVVQRRQR
jgi:Ni2+-binding GTPase involved in maturation of urease and hydrogenase